MSLGTGVSSQFVPHLLTRLIDNAVGCLLCYHVGRNVKGERSLVYCERRNTREIKVAGVGIEPLTKGKIKWGRVLTLPAVLLAAAN
jgi:hypothetical protein